MFRRRIRLPPKCCGKFLSSNTGIGSSMEPDGLWFCDCFCAKSFVRLKEVGLNFKNRVKESRKVSRKKK